MKIKLTKQQWVEAGQRAGWLKTADVDPDPQGAGEASEDYKREQDEDAKRVSFSFGTTPPEIIKERTMQQTPSGYPMTIRSQDEWTAITKAVNQGIDSYLEAFTRSKFDHTTGQCVIHPEEMTTFLRRLYEDGGDEAWGLRSAILETLGIEEI